MSARLGDNYRRTTDGSGVRYGRDKHKAVPVNTDNNGDCIRFFCDPISFRLVRLFAFWSAFATRRVRRVSVLLCGEGFQHNVFEDTGCRKASIAPFAQSFAIFRKTARKSVKAIRVFGQGNYGFDSVGRLASHSARRYTSSILCRISSLSELDNLFKSP